MRRYVILIKILRIIGRILILRSMLRTFLIAILFSTASLFRSTCLTVLIGAARTLAVVARMSAIGSGLIPSISTLTLTLTLLRIAPLARPLVLAMTSAILLTTAFASAVCISAHTTHNQTANLIGVLHTYQVAVRRKPIINITVVAVSKIVILVFLVSRVLRQSSVTDIVHVLAKFLRLARGSITGTDSIPDIVIVLPTAIAILRTPFAFAAVTFRRIIALVPMRIT